MKRFGYLTMLLAVLLLFTSCTVDFSGYGDLAGYVYIRTAVLASSQADDSDILFSAQAAPGPGYSPLQGATVRVSGGGSDATDSDGFFYIPDVRNGSQTVTVKHTSLRQELVRPVYIQVGKPTFLDYDKALVGGIGYYIVIGIDDYPSPHIPDAPGAVEDAISVEDLFMNHTRLAGMVTRLTNWEATRKEIKKIIDEASQAATPDDYLVVYFAGHMGWDYLSPNDDTGTWATAITDSDLESWLRRFPGYVTVILDGSQSATFADGKETLEPLALKKWKYTVISSAGYGQDANVVTSEYGTHGLFTHYFLAGLATPSERVKADMNGDRTITANEIFQYIKSGMYQHVGPSQVPELHQGSTANTIILRY